MHFHETLLGFFVKRMTPAEGAVFLKCQFIRSFPLVLRGGVVPVLTFLASESDDITHGKSLEFQLWCFVESRE